MSGPRKKIAILGGGPAGIAAAFKLTETAALRSRFDVTVYQLGWRLGGKCASGRTDPSVGARIEEHGLHVLSGCYDYTFQMLRRCYAEWNPPAGSKKWKIWEAFREHDNVSLQEKIAGNWDPWNICFPRRPGKPGDQTIEPTAWGLLGDLLPFADRQMFHSLNVDRVTRDLYTAANALGPTFQPFLQAALGFYIGPPGQQKSPSDDKPAALSELAQPLKEPALTPIGLSSGLTKQSAINVIGLAAATASYAAELERYDLEHHGLLSPATEAVLSQAEVFLQAALSAFQSQLEDLTQKVGTDDMRRILLALRAATAVALGIVIDVLPSGSFDVIDEFDFRAWLKHHGAAEEVVFSLVINPGYDYAFAYEDGDTARPGLAAGVAVHAFLRLLLTYRGALFFEMQAAMAEVVFTPLYDVLCARGVQFEFFHRVDVLNVSTSGGQRLIDSIDFAVQMETTSGGPYDPILNVPLSSGELQRCWPSVPNVGQLKRGDKLNGADLEDVKSPWPVAVPLLRLQQGQDYDAIVLAISIGDFPRICAKLIAAEPKWATMVAEVKTVGTMALQLWLNKTTGALGGVQPPTIMTSFEQPLNTWADMTHLRNVEARAVPANSIAYFCGPLNDHVDDPLRKAPRSAGKPTGRPLDWSENLPKIWPGLQQKYGLAPTDPMLDSPDIDDQFSRTNDRGTDRYVLTLPGSTKHRLATDQSGFTNLYLAGDWIHSGINIGCLEAAVFSGIQAAEAIASPDGRLHAPSADPASEIIKSAQETVAALASATTAAVAAGTEVVLTFSDLVFGAGKRP